MSEEREITRCLLKCEEERHELRRKLRRREEMLWVAGAVFIGTILLTCAGCATSYPMTWSRAGSTADDLTREAAQCRVTARTGSAGERDGLMALAMAESNYRDCMIGKGWISTAR